jgi:hypothetical protein
MYSNLGPRWRSVVSLTPRPLYPQGKSPRICVNTEVKCSVLAVPGHFVVSTRNSRGNWQESWSREMNLGCTEREELLNTTLSYGLDDRGSRVRFPTEAGNFSLHHRVQTCSGAHPASYPMGTGGSYTGDKVAGA